MARKMVGHSIKRSSDQLTYAQRSALVVIPLVFVCIFYFLPTLNILNKVVSIDAMSDSLMRYHTIEVVRYTFFQACASTIATLIAGIGPAYLLSRYEFSGRKWLMGLVSVPFMLPTVVVGSAFLALLPESLHETTFAIIIAHVFFEIAVIVRVVGSLWAHIPVDLEQASSTLGASHAKTFRRITLPLLAPALISASTVVFVLTFTSFGVIRILGGASQRTIETEIARHALNLGNTSYAGMLSIIQLVFLGIVFFISHRCSGRWTHALSSHQYRRHIRTARHKQLLRFCIALTSALVLTPLLVIIHSSFRMGDKYSFFAWTHLREYHIRPGVATGVDPLSAIAMSTRYMIFSVFLTTLIGTLAVLAITRLRRLSLLFEGTLMLALITSSVTVGLGMLITFSRWPIDWRASGWIIPIGHTLIALPFVIRILVPVLRSRPAGWADAAATLGASPRRILTTIDFVLLKKPLVNAVGITAAISLGEFGATTLLSRSGNESMPLAIARLLARTGDIPRAQAYMLASILVIITAIIIATLEVKNA